MASIARHTVVLPRAVSAPAAARKAATSGAAPARLSSKGGLPSAAVTLGGPRRGAFKARASATEVMQVALELDSETITTIIAAVAGIGAGLGVPLFFVWQEDRDQARLEEIRELNRATLKATGEQMSEEEITDLRPSRYLDRREFKDDD
mmetsp:Transcript_15178/g.36753  ORF Transcript_15178/g.36753 Transcript_15178/m.36753 type:complete len:149 (-) Transcript_15178:1122-1568(-)